MDVFTLVRAVFRRWYVALPLLAVTALIAVVQFERIHPTYAQASSFIILPSKSLTAATPSAVKSQPVNPIAGTTEMQTLLVTRMNSGEAEQRAAAAGGTGAIGAAGGKEAAIITLESSAGTARATSTTLQAAVTVAKLEMADIQKSVDAPASTYFRLVALNSDLGPSVDYPSRSKSVVLVAIAGVIVTVILCQVLDLFLLGRRRPRDSARSVGQHQREYDDPSGPSGSVDGLFDGPNAA